MKLGRRLNSYGNVTAEVVSKLGVLPCDRLWLEVMQGQKDHGVGRN